MFIVDLLIALAVGLLLTAVFSAGLRNHGPWGLWWVFLLIVFLAAWAGGAWITPFGPPLFGSYWLPMLLTGLIVALLLAAAVPPVRTVRVQRESVAASAAEGAAAVLGVFFWVYILMIAVAIVVAYV